MTWLVDGIGTWREKENVVPPLVEGRCWESSNIQGVIPTASAYGPLSSPAGPRRVFQQYRQD